MKNQSSDALSEHLRQWRMAPRPDPAFRPAVWARISREKVPSWPAYLRVHATRWSVAALVALAGSAWAGHALARSRADAYRDAMVVAYLTELDPRVQAGLRR